MFPGSNSMGFGDPVVPTLTGASGDVVTAQPADPQPPRFGSTKGVGPPPPYNPKNDGTPLGVTHWLAAPPRGFRILFFYIVTTQNDHPQDM